MVVVLVLVPVPVREYCCCCAANDDVAAMFYWALRNLIDLSLIWFARLLLGLQLAFFGLCFEQKDAA